MALYAGIDLHSNNNVVVLLNEQDQVVYQQRLANQLPIVLEQLAPYREEITGVVVDSTYNWSWLVDGFMDAGSRVHLANPAAMQQYSGLKHSDDHADARWLAHLLRLGVLPQGYIYPKAQRAVRDVLRKRAHLVRHHTSHVLSVQNILARNTGLRFSVKQLHQLNQGDLEALLPETDQVLAVTSSLTVMACLSQQIHTVEKAVRNRLKHTPAYEHLLSVKGIGEILAQTIALETGEIARFATGGNDASYCRCVRSTKLSNGKRKGQGNVKNGNPYLEWAYMEAAQFAIRFHPKVQRFSQRKAAKNHVMVARKSVAHTLARACFDVIRDQVPFDGERAFGCGRATSWVEGRDR